MNISRVIYLDQNAVVAACECMRPSKYEGREIGRKLRREIERCVEDGLAIFPYSEVHLSEAANVTDPESRAEQIRFGKRFRRAIAFMTQESSKGVSCKPFLKSNRFDLRVSSRFIAHSCLLRKNC